MLTHSIHSDSNLNRRLLIVDDVTAILEALSDSPSINNYSTIEPTTHAISALLIASTFKPDSSLLDIKHSRTNNMNNCNRDDIIEPRHDGHHPILTPRPATRKMATEKIKNRIDIAFYHGHTTTNAGLITVADRTTYHSKKCSDNIYSPFEPEQMGRHNDY